MNKILTFDFETKDPYIKLKLGPGWAYAYNVKDNLLKVLGCAVSSCNITIPKYVTNWDELADIIMEHDELLAHNATYDLGILYCLYKDNKKVTDKIKSMPVHDTRLLYKLYNNSLLDYSLDGLAKKYISEPKGYQILIDAVWENGLYPWLKKDLNSKTIADRKGLVYLRSKPEDKKILKFAYENMDLVQKTDFKRMAEYAISDVDITFKLFTKVFKELDSTLIEKYSILSHICVGYRLKGVRIDLTQAHHINERLIRESVEKCKEVYKIAGIEFNINSPKDIPPILDRLGISYEKTEAGNPSVTTPWLEKQSHPICKALLEARKYKKIRTDFIQKIINMQEYTCPDAGSYGMVYPILNILEARTGRFSCRFPNIQQIPSRDKILGPLCRSIFVPFKGEKWYSLDFSNQEGRLQVHYANEMGCEGANELALLFNKQPDFDMHQKVADLARITRSEAKTINLGISYGMGIAKLATSLGISESEAYILREKYSNLAPFLNGLNKLCIKVMKERGYIKTLSKRKSYVDAPVFIGGKRKTFEYKALNKLIQGSAADQIIEAMIISYNKGIPVLFPVHDSLEISGTHEQAEALKVIMETCVSLTVPSLVEIKEGNNWGECK